MRFVDNKDDLFYEESDETEDEFVDETEDEKEIICAEGEIICIRCGQSKIQHKRSKTVCVDCVKAQAEMMASRRSRNGGNGVSRTKSNENWMEIAKSAELELWERQPREIDFEWNIWQCYRDQYPVKKPTYTSVANDLGIDVSKVRAIGDKWNYAVRMQTWIRKIDLSIQEDRLKSLVDMNAQHIRMANKLNEKLETAIEFIEPGFLKPNEISALMRTATELERKANVDCVDVNKTMDTIKDEKLGITRVGGACGINGGVTNEGKNKKDDLQQIVDILAKAGALEIITGIKKTVTTEISVGDDVIDVTSK